MVVFRRTVRGGMRRRRRMGQRVMLVRRYPSPFAVVLSARTEPQFLRLVVRVLALLRSSSLHSPTPSTPVAQRARDGERALHSFQTTQLHTYSEQLRDAHAASERLRTENLALLQRVSTAERERDLAQLELRLQKGGDGEGAPVTSRRSKASGKPRRRSHFKGYPDMDVRGGKFKVVESFPEGGSHTYWMTDPSTDASGAEDYNSDSDKENRPPRISRWRDHSPFVHYKPPQPSSSSSATRVEDRSSPRKAPSSPVKHSSNPPLTYQSSQDM